MTAIAMQCIYAISTLAVVLATASAQDSMAPRTPQILSQDGSVHIRLPRDGDLLVTREVTSTPDALEERIAALENSIMSLTPDLSDFQNEVVTTRTDAVAALAGNFSQQIADLRAWVQTTMTANAAANQATLSAAATTLANARTTAFSEMQTALDAIGETSANIRANITAANNTLVNLNSPNGIVSRIRKTYIADPKTPVYRWGLWNTYANANIGWFDENERNGFGGIAPQRWTDNNAVAWDMTDDIPTLTRLLINKATAPVQGSSVCTTVDVHYSSTDGTICGAMFRIRNTASKPVTWSPAMTMSSWNGWSEMASISVNGENTWNGDCPNQCIWSPHLTLPAGTISTIVFMGTSGVNAGGGDNFHQRGTILMFRDYALRLPNYLEYVDDFDVATGGWKV